MCGRYTLTTQRGVVEELRIALDEPSPPELWRPRFNIAPTQPAPVVANRAGPRRLELMRWGLLPPWAKSLAESARRINARVESVATTAAFRDAFRHRRCLVLADGFFEWRHEGKRRLPFYFRPAPPRLVTFAGLWERWKAPDGEWLLSFTILTGRPNPLVAAFHDRMPLVIAAADRDRWLEPAEASAAALDRLLAPWPADDWTVSEVSQRVNRPQHDDPACLEPASASSPPASPSDAEP
jgi:putative SOS response-associated peptidase YedK